MKTTFLLLLLLSPWILKAQSSYAVSGIPDSLKTHAHSVIRSEELTLVVSSPAKATYKVHRVITILDKEGDTYLTFEELTSKFIKLEDAVVNAFDAGGKQIGHVRQKDMNGAVYGSNLVDDGHLTYYKTPAGVYPITVEEDFTLTFKGIIAYPTFDLDNTERAIQQASFSATVPTAAGIRYKNRHTNLQPLIQDGPKDTRTYTWSVSGLKGQRFESWTLEGDGPAVLLAPNAFDVDDNPGDMSTWASFGKWYYDLNKDAFVLPETSKDFYRRLVAGAPTDLDKARILYSYLQKNFRYVSIQLGIGGFRAFPAGFTESKKYGDCKGLSAYMKACLDAVGVKSYVALVNAGELEAPVDPSFPDSHFNHVILCLPNAGDTTWLECTSKLSDFGLLGDFAEDRNALLVTEKGGVLVRTPSSRPEENRSSSFTLVTLSPDGSGQVLAHLAATGAFKRQRIAGLYEQSRDNQKRYLVSALRFMSPDDLLVYVHDIDTPVFKADVQLTLEKVPDFMAGNKMFLHSRLYPILYREITAADKRTHDFYFPEPFQLTDTTCYLLPDGYSVGQLPTGETRNAPNATFTSAYWYDASKKAVFSAGTLTLMNRDIPAQDFPQVKRLLNLVEAESAQKIVIDKK